MGRDDNYFAFVFTNASRTRARVNRFTFHRNWLFVGAFFALILLGAVGFGLYGLSQRALHQQTAQENLLLRDRDDKQQQKFNELNERIKAVEEKSRRIAAMAGTAGETTETPATTGPSPASSNLSNPSDSDLNGAGGPEIPLDWNIDESTEVTPEDLARKVALLEKKLRDYEVIISQQAVRPSIWPVTGRLTDFFGPRRNPFGGGGGEFHPGQDIANTIGTPIIATANGTVLVADWQSGYGRLVEIDHGNGITTRYGHMSKIAVEPGQLITRGQVVGFLGSTGRSTGPHLHYEVRLDNEPVNPLDYLPREEWVEAELNK